MVQKGGHSRGGHHVASVVLLSQSQQVFVRAGWEVRRDTVLINLGVRWNLREERFKAFWVELRN